jgi:MYND finger
MTVRIYSCSRGCGFSTPNKGDLKVCTRCRLARYCNKSCRVNHWKNVHKEECVPIKEQKVQYIMVDVNDDNLEAVQAKARAAEELAKKALDGRAGSAVYLGEVISKSGTKSKFNGGNLPEHKILTDVWTMDTEKDYQQTSLQELYLPPVPPALLCKAEDIFMETPNTQLEEEAVKKRCQRLLLKEPFLQDNVHPIWFSNVFKNAVMSLFVCTDNFRRQDALEFLQVAASLSRHHQMPLPHGNHQGIVGSVLKLDGGIEMVYITPPMICFPEPTKSELAFFNESTLKSSYPAMHSFPLLRSPIVAYRCVEEGWMIVRGTNLMHMLYATDSTRTLHFLERELIFLKIFVVAAELGIWPVSTLHLIQPKRWHFSIGKNICSFQRRTSFCKSWLRSTRRLNEKRLFSSRNR